MPIAPLKATKATRRNRVLSSEKHTPCVSPTPMFEDMDEVTLGYISKLNDRISQARR